MHNWKFTTIT